MTGKRTPLYNIAALLGAGLLLLNLWGLVSPNDQRNLFPEAALMSYSDAINILESMGTELTPAEAVTLANQTVYQAMDPGWPEHAARILARQNWLLWLAGFFDQAAVSCGLTGVEDLFSVYQMTDHRRALQRGFGLCSQQTLVLAGFVDELLGYKVQVAGLSGHVVLQVTLPDGSRLLADPHKGVVMPFGLAHAQTHPDAVAAAYPQGSYIPPLYDAAGNQLVPGPASAYNPKLYQLERISYVLIWLVPALLLLPLLLSRTKKS